MKKFLRSYEVRFMFFLSMILIAICTAVVFYENSVRVNIDANINKDAVAIECAEFTSIVDPGSSCFKSRGYLVVKLNHTTKIYDPISRTNVATITTSGSQLEIDFPWNKASTEAFWTTFNN